LKKGWRGQEIFDRSFLAARFAALRFFGRAAFKSGIQRASG
jgi:hypothetical protein